jgi:hypothetical protein
MHSQRAIITFLDSGEVDPGYGQGGGGNYPTTGPIYGGGHPSQGLPGSGNYPSHGLPGGGHISLLPVFPFDPTRPSNELPGNQPEAGNELPVRPGRKFVVKWLCGVGMILVPDNSLPSSGGSIDNELPEHAQPK